MCCEQGSGSYKVEFNGVQEVFNDAFSEGASIKADFGCNAGTAPIVGDDDDDEGGDDSITEDPVTEAPVEPFCGNGVVDSGEECDDGNTNDGTSLDLKKSVCAGENTSLLSNNFVFITSN
jgi:cysteine-rich repeat protein